MQKSNKSSLFHSRASRVATLSLTAVLLLLAVLVAVNALIGALPSRYTLFNLARANVFQLSGKTQDWLKNMNTPVTLSLIYTGGKAQADRDILGFLENYAEECDAITVEVIDPRANKDFIEPFGGEWPEDGSVLIRSDKRYRLVENDDLYYYYNSILETNMSAEEYDTMQQTMSEMDETGEYLLRFAETTQAYFDGEARVTNAINFVIQEKIAVAYVVTGNGGNALNSQMQSLLSQTGYELRTLLSLSEIPADCELLILNAPGTDLSANDTGALSAYLSGGGKLFLTTYYRTGELANLNSVLMSYGLSFSGKDYVCDGNAGYYFTDSNGSYPELFRAHIAQHGITENFMDTFVVYNAHSITLTETEGVTLTKWLYTSEAGYLKQYNESTKTYDKSDEVGEYTFGAIAEKGDTCIVWLACPAALEPDYNALSENSGNFALACAAMNYMTGANVNGISIESVSMSTELIAVTGAQFAVIAVILVVLLPLSVLTAGLVIWNRRKRR